MLGNVTVQQTSGGCNVTSCDYDGIVNGTIATTYVYFLCTCGSNLAFLHCVFCCTILSLSLLNFCFRLAGCPLLFSLDVRVSVT